jgi:sugar (pentulose or hexulose) kinase
MVAPGPSFEPSPARVSLYDDLYQVYLSLYPALRSLFQSLAEVES